MEKLELIEKVPLTSHEKEVYRTLRTNVEFTGVENRVIAITSCAPDEGKTTIAYNLAIAFAENGKKALYIDADLRKSVFVQRYGIEGNPKGLSHYLSGQVSLKDVVYKTNRDRLYVTPIGRFPSNPTELFNKDRFGQLLEELKKVFDYVIIDTPPLGSVVDAAVIAQKCDASMLVVTSDECSRNVVKRIFEAGFEIENADITIAAQKPKLMPYIEQMRKNMSNDLEIDINCVNVKATTTEKLGFEGREEGISAYAVVLLK